MVEVKGAKLSVACSEIVLIHVHYQWTMVYNVQPVRIKQRKKANHALP